MATPAKLATVPTLAALLDDPRKINGLPREAIPHLRGELAQLDTLLLNRLLTEGSEPQHGALSGDRLLDAKQTADKLGTSPDWLYRNAPKLPFTVRVGKKQLRFSEAGIDRYIRQRAGRLTS